GGVRLLGWDSSGVDLRGPFGPSAVLGVVLTADCVDHPAGHHVASVGAPVAEIDPLGEVVAILRMLAGVLVAVDRFRLETTRAVLVGEEPTEARAAEPEVLTGRIRNVIVENGGPRDVRVTPDVVEGHAKEHREQV